MNFPIRLTDKLSNISTMLGDGEFPPTDQMIAVKDELFAGIDRVMQKFEMVKKEMIPAFNRMVRDKSIDAIILKNK